MNTNRRPFRLSEAQQRANDPARWHRIFSNPALLIHTVVILQRTMRMAKYLATWDAFMQTEYYFDIANTVGTEGTRFLRAWWDLIGSVAPGREPTRGECEYIVAVLTARHMQTRYAKSPAYDAKAFGIDEENAERIKELCLLGFRDLVKD